MASIKSKICPDTDSFGEYIIKPDPLYFTASKDADILMEIRMEGSTWARGRGDAEEVLPHTFLAAPGLFPSFPALLLRRGRGQGDGSLPEVDALELFSHPVLRGVKLPEASPGPPA